MITKSDIVQLIQDAHKRFSELESALADETDKVFGFIDLTASTKYKALAKSNRLGVARSLFHLLLCTQILERLGCTKLKNIGDEVMFSTKSAADAVAACEAVRIAYELLNDDKAYSELRDIRFLLGLGESDPISIAAKSGVGKGPVYEIPDFLGPNDGLGLPIDRAARCVSKGQPNFIVVDGGIYGDLAAAPHRLPVSLHLSKLISSYAKGLGIVNMALVSTDEERVNEIARYTLDPWSMFDGYFDVVDMMLNMQEKASKQDLTASELSRDLWDVMRKIEEVLAYLREIDREHVHGGSLMLVYKRDDIQRMRKAYHRARTSKRRPKDEFLARRVPFIAPKWREPLPREDQDVYITVEFYMDEEWHRRPRDQRLRSVVMYQTSQRGTMRT